MSIETKLDALIAAIEANTAALTGSKPAAAAKPTAAEKPAAAPDKPARGRPAAAKSEHSKDEVMAALNEVKEAHGIEAAREILGAHGYKKMVDMKDKDFDAIYDAAKAKMGEGEDGGDGAGDDDI